MDDATKVVNDYINILKSNAEKGESWAQAKLGESYVLAENYSLAIYWLNKAVAQNHPAAQFYLGVMYYYGTGVERNRALGKQYLQQSANQGYEASKEQLKKINASEKNGCYVATCVYGSYDCPEVWTLRRYRDDTLGQTWYGRIFIRIYYAISPKLVKLFGNKNWFKIYWKKRLDKKVSKLQTNGVENTPYEDQDWRK